MRIKNLFVYLVHRRRFSRISSVLIKTTRTSRVCILNWSSLFRTSYRHLDELSHVTLNLIVTWPLTSGAEPDGLGCFWTACRERSNRERPWPSGLDQKVVDAPFSFTLFLCYSFNAFYCSCCPSPSSATSRLCGNNWTALGSASTGIEWVRHGDAYGSWRSGQNTRVTGEVKLSKVTHEISPLDAKFKCYVSFKKLNCFTYRS